MNIVSVSEIQRNNLFGDANCLIKQVDRDVSDGDRLAEFGARVCYRTQKRFLDAPKFLNGIMDAKHYDVLEHSHIVFNATNTIAVERDLFMFQKYLNCAYYGYSEFGVSGNLRAWMDFLRRMHDVQFRDIRSLLNFVTSIYGNYQHVNPIKHDISNWTEAVPLIEYKPQKDFYSEAVVRLIGSSSHIFEDPDVAAKLNHASFYIEKVSRVTTHQLVRHRRMSYCLAGDTVIKSHNGDKKWTMETLYNWYSNPKKYGAALSSIRLRGMGSDRKLHAVKIKSVVKSGLKNVYEIKVRSGRKLQSTLEHLYSTPSGWKKLGELSVGDTVWTNGIEAYKDKDFIRKEYIEKNRERKEIAAEIGCSDATLGKWIAKFGLQKPKSSYPNRVHGCGKKGCHTEKGLNVLRDKCGDKNSNWKEDSVGVGGGRLRAMRKFVAESCSLCQSTTRVQRHHIDKNPRNNDANNIEILCESCHKARHNTKTRLVLPDEIISITYVGKKETYDLEIDDPCHNFVAQGFVVHNSQASQRYIGLEKGEWGYTIPETIYTDDECCADYMDYLGEGLSLYKKFRDKGIPKEDARFVLPSGIHSSIMVSGHLEDWRDLLSQRTASDTQWEFNEIAQQIEDQLHMIAPKVFPRNESNSISK